MKALDTKTLAQYENQYIATSQDSQTVYASGATIAQVEKQLEKQKIKNAIIGFIPSVNKAIPHSSPKCNDLKFLYSAIFLPTLQVVF